MKVQIAFINKKTKLREQKIAAQCLFKSTQKAKFPRGRKLLMP